MSASPSARFALLMDELLARPDLADLLAEAAASGALKAAGWQDQFDAAFAQVLTVGTSHLPTGDVPGWMRLSLLSVFAAWMTGTADTCTHAPSPHRPRPVVTAAWKPNLVVCAPQCWPLLELKAGCAADRTCDQCGTVVDGTLDDDPIWTGHVSLGPFLWAFGVCSDCFAGLPSGFRGPPEPA